MDTTEKVATGLIASVAVVGGVAYAISRYKQKQTIDYNGKLITPTITIYSSPTVILAPDVTDTVGFTVKVTYDGKPLEGVFITLIESGEELDEGKTNSDGEYSANLEFNAIGDYTLEVYISGTKYE